MIWTNREICLACLRQFIQAEALWKRQDLKDTHLDKFSLAKELFSEIELALNENKTPIMKCFWLN